MHNFIFIYIQSFFCCRAFYIFRLTNNISTSKFLYKKIAVIRGSMYGNNVEQEQIWYSARGIGGLENTKTSRACMRYVRKSQG